MAFVVALFSVLMMFTATSWCNLFNPTDYIYTVHRLGRCNEENKYDIFVKFNNFSVSKQDGVHVTFAGALELTKPVQINFRLSIHGLICDGPEDRTCKHSFIRKFGYICRKLREPDQPWYAFLGERFRCPILVGNYDLENATIDINAFSYLPLFDGYWVIKAYGYSGSDIVMCVYSEMELTPETHRRGLVMPKP